MPGGTGGTHQTQTIRITFVQRRPNVFNVDPKLYKCYTNGLCLLGTDLFCRSNPEDSTCVLFKLQVTAFHLFLVVQIYWGTADVCWAHSAQTLSHQGAICLFPAGIFYEWLVKVIHKMVGKDDCPITWQSASDCLSLYTPLQLLSCFYRLMQTGAIQASLCDMWRRTIRRETSKSILISTSASPYFRARSSL